MVRLLTIALLAAFPAQAAGQDHLAELLKGRTAEPPKRCISPDPSVQAEIIDGTALVYRDARYTYVGRFKGGCPALRDGRRVITRRTGGQYCENDPVRVTEQTGGGFGFCAFDQFTPYRKK